MHLCLICLIVCYAAFGGNTEDIADVLPNLQIDTSLGLAIRAPEFERRLKGAKLELWISLLRDAREISALGNKDPGSREMRQQGEEREDWRVNDVAYYFYAKLHPSETVAAFPRNARTRDRELQIGMLVSKLEANFLYVAAFAKSIAFETPFRVLEVLLRSIKEGDYNLYLATLSGEAAAATVPVNGGDGTDEKPEARAARDEFGKQAAGIARIPEVRFCEKDGRLYAELKVIRKADKEATQQQMTFRFSNTPIGWRIDKTEKSPEQPLK